MTDLDGFVADVRAREDQMATGLPGGIGIPHARSEHVTQASLVFGRAPEGIDWGAADGPANLVFLIAGPKGSDESHLSVLGHPRPPADPLRLPPVAARGAGRGDRGRGRAAGGRRGMNAGTA